MSVAEIRAFMGTRRLGIGLLRTSRSACTCRTFGQIMNLNSLPDELLVGIFKYNSYPTMRQVRKIDSRLDRIAKRYDLGIRVPVKDVVYVLCIKVKWKNCKGKKRLRKRIIRGSCDLELGKDIRDYFNLPYYIELDIHGTNSQQEMENVLKRIQIQNEFFYDIEGAAFPDSFIDGIIKEKRCLRDVKKLCLYVEDVMRVSKDKLKKLFSVCKNATGLSYVVKKGIDILCSLEVVGSKKWQSINIITHEGDSVFLGVDRQFLFQTLKNCMEIRFSCFGPIKLGFTVMDLIDLVEICLREDGFISKQVWLLPVLRLGSSIERVHSRLKQIEDIAVCFANKRIYAHRYNSFVFQCKIISKPDVLIEFQRNSVPNFDIDNFGYTSDSDDDDD